MAGGNIELARTICTAWERGDYSSSDWAHPEIEFVIADGPAPGEWSGLAGMAEGWRTWLGAWDGFHQEADGYRELDGERVIAFFRGYGHAKASGMDLAHMNHRSIGAFQFRDGKVTRFAVYFDRDRAFADLGVRDSADR